jgi:hypothetical protein
MSVSLVRCQVLGADVTRVTDLEGAVTHLMCPEYQQSTGSCRLMTKARGGGPLSQLLERVTEGTLDQHGTQCHLGLRPARV